MCTTMISLRSETTEQKHGCWTYRNYQRRENHTSTHSSKGESSYYGLAISGGLDGDFPDLHR